MNQVLTSILSKIKKDLKNKKTSGIFSKSLLNPRSGNVSIIAEIKLASPTERFLGSEKEVLKRAKVYEKSGVEAVSFITEKEVFKGDVKLVSKIKSAVKLPLLQKDFIIDPYQIYEAKLSGSDALLLIAKILSQNQLMQFIDLCMEIGLEAVVEINDEKDLEKALKTRAKIIAVNARNLDTLKVDLDEAIKLLSKVPEEYIKLGFSGIRSKTDVEKYQKAGARAVLIGTNLMKAKNISEFLKGLR